MADQLSLHWKNLKISQEEKEHVDLRVEGAKMKDVRLSLCLLGKLITNKKFNKEAMKRTLKSVWNLSNGVVIRNLDYNLFMFQFFHWEDKKKVQDGMPWCFDQQLLVLKEVESGLQPWQVEFTHSLFWLRIYDLPFDSNTVEDAKAVASRVGEVVEVDEIDEVGWEKSFRVRVLMDIRKPIRRWQKIRNKAGEDAWVVFKYERLPFICFECGIIGHNDKSCVFGGVSSADNGEEKPYGMWLRASPMEDRNKAREEVLELKARGPLEFTPLPEAMLMDRQGMGRYIEGTENMLQTNISTTGAGTQNMLQTNISTTGADMQNMLQTNISTTGAGMQNMLQTNISTTGAGMQNMLQTYISTAGAGRENMLQTYISTAGASMENVLQTNVSTAGAVTHDKLQTYICTANAGTENMLAMMQTNISTADVGTESIRQTYINRTDAGTEKMMQTNLSAVTNLTNTEGTEKEYAADQYEHGCYFY